MSLVEILAKIQNGTATTEEVESLSKLYAQEQENKKKAEEAFNKLITSIKNAKIDPVVLYSKLVEEGLIVIPSGAATASDKVVIASEKVTTKEGRASSFKVWIGRPLDKLVGDAKTYWTALQAKGKDYFVSILNDDGKEYYATAEGKKWIDGLFSTK